jgi:hypothetical protein
MFARTIEQVIKTMIRYADKKGRDRVCKNCLREAEKLRGPLDRLADV